VTAESIYDFEVTALDGTVGSMGDYRGKLLLIVNVASRCGFTPQYAGLERLHRRYQDQGLLVLGFPCNQFGKQEPGSPEDIRRFCSDAYDVTFPLFAKIDVNGPNTHPLYRYLKAQEKGVLGLGVIKWNFTKFLVSTDGKVLRRYAPKDSPERIERDLASLLPAPRQRS
jgi:glutathione peroxidase